MPDVLYSDIMSMVELTRRFCLFYLKNHKNSFLGISTIPTLAKMSVKDFGSVRGESSFERTEQKAIKIKKAIFKSNTTQKY